MLPYICYFKQKKGICMSNHEFIIILDPTDEKTPSKIKELFAVQPDAREIFDNGIAFLLEDENFDKVCEEITPMLAGLSYVLAEATSIYSNGI